MPTKGHRVDDSAASFTTLQGTNASRRIALAWWPHQALVVRETTLTGANVMTSRPRIRECNFDLAQTDAIR
jgi:hypothetical protein